MAKTMGHFLKTVIWLPVFPFSFSKYVSTNCWFLYLCGGKNAIPWNRGTHLENRETTKTCESRRENCDHGFFRALMIISTMPKAAWGMGMSFLLKSGHWFQLGMSSFPKLCFGYGNENLIQGEVKVLLLTKIFDQSISTSTLPSAWTTANVAAIYKKGSRTDPANYRPVCCKVLEHVIYSHIMRHLDHHKAWAAMLNKASVQGDHVKRNCWLQSTRSGKLTKTSTKLTPSY